jgi:hypothetical protein
METRPMKDSTAFASDSGASEASAPLLVAQRSSSLDLVLLLPFVAVDDDKPAFVVVAVVVVGIDIYTFRCIDYSEYLLF